MVDIRSFFFCRKMERLYLALMRSNGCSFCCGNRRNHRCKLGRYAISRPSHFRSRFRGAVASIQMLPSKMEVGVNVPALAAMRFAGWWLCPLLAKPRRILAPARYTHGAIPASFWRKSTVRYLRNPTKPLVVLQLHS